MAVMVISNTETDISKPASFHGSRACPRPQPPPRRGVGETEHLLEIQRTGWKGSRPLRTTKAAVQTGSSSTDQATEAAALQPST